MHNINAMRALASVDINSVMNNPDSMSERLAMSLQMMILGLATVFAVLIILWGVLVLFRIFFYDMRMAKKAPAASKDQAPKADPAPAVPAPVAEPVPAADDKQLIAVIAAAIAEAEGKPASAFRVVSFRRAGSPRWNER